MMQAFLNRWRDEREMGQSLLKQHAQWLEGFKEEVSRAAGSLNHMAGVTHVRDAGATATWQQQQQQQQWVPHDSVASEAQRQQQRQQQRQRQQQQQHQKPPAAEAPAPTRLQERKHPAKQHVQEPISRYQHQQQQAQQQRQEQQRQEQQRQQRPAAVSAPEATGAAAAADGSVSDVLMRELISALRQRAA